MRIHISFSEAAQHGFNIEQIINNNQIEDDYSYITECHNIGEELQEYIIENYFNGADLAVNYITFNELTELIEFELIQN